MLNYTDIPVTYCEKWKHRVQEKKEQMPLWKVKGEIKREVPWDENHTAIMMTDLT